MLVPQPDGIEFEVPAPTQVVVRGNDKQLVGETAANIRKIRKPELYKGKGIRYENEYVRKKAGRAGEDGLMDAKTRRACAGACPQDDRRHLGAAAPGRVPVQPAHLRATDRRPRGRDASSASDAEVGGGDGKTASAKAVGG